MLRFKEQLIATSPVFRYTDSINRAAAGNERNFLMFDTTKVAKRIKEARVAQNLTQMQLADAMGVSYQAVSNWERGDSLR